jgi:hypothetical protein
VKQQIKFTLGVAEISRDAIKLDCMGDSMEIPVIAYPPAPRFATDTELIDLGVMGVQAQATFSFTLTNVGVREGSFKIESPDPSIVLAPASATVSSADSTVIAGTFTPAAVGFHSYTITVMCDEQLEAIPTVVLKAKSVTINAVLLYQSAAVEELDFGMLYYSQKRAL